MSSPVLELHGLTKTYPKLTALSDVNLSIRQGEIFALLGPNGAGKTTLIGSVCGLVKKTRGRILLFGKDLDVDPVRPRATTWAWCPRRSTSIPFFTVAEALHIQLGYYGQPRDEARVDEVLTALNLQGKKDTAGPRALRRHEAPPAHRQGAGAPPQARLPRRAHRRRGRGAAPRLVDLRPQAAPPRAPPSSSPPTTSRRPRSWPTGWASSTRGACCWWRTRPR